MKIRIYSKKDCHFCEVAKSILKKYAGKFSYEIEEVDIESDSALFEMYRYDIPVIFLDEKKIFKHRIDESKLERILKSYIKP